MFKMSLGILHIYSFKCACEPSTHKHTSSYSRVYILYGNVNIFTTHIGCFVLLYGYSEQQQHIRICIMIIIAAITYVKCTQAPNTLKHI